LAPCNLLGGNFSGKKKQITSIFKVGVPSTLKIEAPNAHKVIKNHLPENTL
jgi:hypothetical protein